MNPRRNPPHMLLNNPYLTQGNTTPRPLPTYRSAHQQPGPSGHTNPPVQTSPSHSLLQTPDVLIRVTDRNTNLSTTHSSGGTSAASFDPYGQFGPKCSATGLSSLVHSAIASLYPRSHTSQTPTWYQACWAKGYSLTADSTTDHWRVRKQTFSNAQSG